MKPESTNFPTIAEYFTTKRLIMQPDPRLIMKLKLLIYEHGLYKVIEMIREIILEAAAHSAEGSEADQVYRYMNINLIRAAIRYDEFKCKGN